MKKIRWGIIGLGNIANKFAQAVTKMQNTELVAVASRTKEKSENFGNNYGVAGLRVSDGNKAGFGRAKLQGLNPFYERILPAGQD